MPINVDLVSNPTSPARRWTMCNIPRARATTEGILAGGRAVTNPRGGPTGTDYPAVLLNERENNRHYSWWGLLYPDVSVDTDIQLQTGSVETLSWVPHAAVGEQTCGLPFQLDSRIIPNVQVLQGGNQVTYIARDVSRAIEYENSPVHRSFYYQKSAGGFHIDYYFTIWTDQIVKSEAHGLGGIVDFAFQLVWHDRNVKEHYRSIDEVLVIFSHEAVIPLAVKNKFALTTTGTVGVNRVQTKVSWAMNDWDPGRIYHGRSLPIRGMLLARVPGVTGDDEANLVAFRGGTQRTKLTFAEWDGEFGAHGVPPELPDNTSHEAIDLAVPGLLFDGRPDGQNDPCLLPDTGASGSQGSFGAMRGGLVLHDFHTMDEYEWAIEDWGLRSIHYRDPEGTPFNPNRRDSTGRLIYPRATIQMLHGKLWSSGFGLNLLSKEDGPWEISGIWDKYPVAGKSRPIEAGGTKYRDALEDEHPSFNSPAAHYLLTRDPLSWAWGFDFMSMASIWRRWFVDWPAAHRAHGRLANALAQIANAMPQFWQTIKNLVDSEVYRTIESQWRGKFVTVPDVKILTASFPYVLSNGAGNKNIEDRWNISYIGFSDVVSITSGVDPTIIVPTTAVQSELFEANNPAGVYCIIENVGDILGDPGKKFPFNGAHVNGSGEIVLPGVTFTHTGGGYDLTNADVRLVATVWNVPFTIIGFVGLWILAKEVGHAALQALALEGLETVFDNGTYITSGGQHRVPFALHYPEITDPVFKVKEGTKIDEAHRTDDGNPNFWRVSKGSLNWTVWGIGGAMIIRDNSLNAPLVTKVTTMISDSLVAGKWPDWQWSAFAASGKI